MKTLSLNQISTSKPTGYVLWSGKSRFNGEKIVVIATGFGRASKNVKTGDMIQTWILPVDRSPVEAVNEGKDMAVCGNCPHSGNQNKTCYVNVGQAPLAIWKAYHRGVYPALPSYDVFSGRNVRFGSYGDPAMVPLSVWKSIKSVCADNTGYTHQWRKRIGRGLIGMVMASCDSQADHVEAVKSGWRTFTVVNPGDMPQDRQFFCPSSPEGGDKKTCAECMACDGLGERETRANPIIVVHGKRKKAWTEYTTR